MQTAKKALRSHAIPLYVLAFVSFYYGLFVPTPAAVPWLHEFAWATFGGSFILAVVAIALSV